MIRTASVIAFVALTSSAWAQGNQPGAAAPQRQRAAPPARKDTTAGFAIADQTVIARCGSCHVRDSTGLMERLSYLRKTPEGWEISIRRMVALQHVRVDPTEAR